MLKDCTSSYRISKKSSRILKTIAEINPEREYKSDLEDISAICPNCEEEKEMEFVSNIRGQSSGEIYPTYRCDECKSTFALSRLQDVNPDLE